MILKGLKETELFDGDFPIRIVTNAINDFFDYPMHWHHAVELCYVLEGSYSVEANNKLYELKCPDILFIAAGDVHSLPYQKQPGKRMFLQFMLEDIGHLCDLKDVMPFLSRTFLITAELDRDLHKAVSTRLDELKEVYEKKDLAYGIRIYALVLDIIADISSYAFYKPVDTHPSSIKNREYLNKIGELFKYIEKHYQEDISLDDAAKAVGFSRYYLTRCLKEAMGKSFLQFLHEYRVKKAEKLLLTGEMTMTEIASSTGFGSISSFNRVFKELKGCSPLEYRKAAPQRGNF